MIGKTIVTLMLLAWIAKRVDWPQFFGGLGALGALSWGALLTLQGIIVVLLGFRLSAVGDLPIRFTVPVTFKAQFFQVAAPAQLGSDMYRAWSLVNERRFSWTAATTQVLVDRGIGVATLALYAIVAAVVGGFETEIVDVTLASDLSAMSYAAVAFGSAGVMLVAWLFRHHRHLSAVSCEIQRVWHRLTTARVFAAVFYCLAMYLILAVMALVVMHQLSEESLAAAFAVPPLVQLATLVIPLSVNGIGVRETAAVVLYGAHGFDPTASLLIVTAPFLASLFMAWIGFVWWSMDRARNVSEI